MKKRWTPSCQVLKGPLKNIMQGRWQVGEELRGGGDPIFVTCSLPRLPVACTSLRLGNAGRGSKEWGVGRQVSCSWRSGWGKQGPEGSGGKGRGGGRVAKAPLLELQPRWGGTPKPEGASKSLVGVAGRVQAVSGWPPGLAQTTCGRLFPERVWSLPLGPQELQTHS